MIVSLLVPVLIVVVIMLVRRKPGTSALSTVSATSVRLFFQYLLLFGLVVVVAIGVSGLLGRALEPRPFAQDDLALARNLAFVVVGAPLLALVTWWSWRREVADPAERTTMALAFTVLLAGVVSLVMVMTSAHAVLVWLFGVDDNISRTPLATLLTWGPVLAAVWWVSRIIAAPVLRLYHLVGSLLGLATAAAGAVGLLGDLVSRAIFDDNPDRYAAGLWSALASVLVGLPVWALYWWARARHAEGDTPWLAFVLLAGVGGGFVAAVVAFSTALATTGIWLFGEPDIDIAELHFRDFPLQAAAAVVGLLVWWYHRTVLDEARAAARTGVQRVYEYMMAGIALVAAAVGLMFMVAAGIEAAAGPDAGPGRGPVVNTLVVAATVLLVGLPVWALFWRRAQLARRADPARECGSTLRRTYLGAAGRCWRRRCGGRRHHRRLPALP
jgi:hypothetical protein